MSKTLPILLHPHTVLRAKAAPLSDVSDATRTTLANMLETLHTAQGIGLAAPQIGLSQRIVVIEHEVEGEPGHRTPKSGSKPLLMVNPTLLATSTDMIESEEGCLSIPWLYDVIHRHAEVKVGYLDEHGNPQTVEADGLLSRCLQHELDHLDGVLFIDHLSRLKRGLADKKYKKLLVDFVDDKPYPFVQE
ncbi:MAG: peptide deformylase [Alphaproteobacteria bacterium]